MHLALGKLARKKGNREVGTPLPEEVVSKSNDVIEREDLRPRCRQRTVCCAFREAAEHDRAHAHLHKSFRGDRTCAVTALGDGEQEIQRPRED